MHGTYSVKLKFISPSCFLRTTVSYFKNIPQTSYHITLLIKYQTDVCFKVPKYVSLDACASVFDIKIF
jgi:hypothetical protein